jgi:hypothetical protein
MAQVAALRQAYVCLGFMNAAATNITNNQDVDSLDELKVLRDEDIVNLCKVVRRPGGMIPNPQAGRRTWGPSDHPQPWDSRIPSG